MDKTTTSLKKRPGLHMKLLTVKELSEIINVKEKTLYHWVELRQIPFFRLNGSIRFNPDEIVTWLEENRREASTGYNIPAQAARDPRKGG